MVHIAVNVKKKGKFQWQRFTVASHWNFQKEDVDTVFVYSNCEQVELFLNNKSLGRKEVNKDTYQAIYQVKYKEGTLKAVAFNHSKLIAEHILHTAGNPDHLSLNPEKNTVEWSKSELVYIPVEVTDKNGNRCPLSTNNIRLTVEGTGDLIGLDSGNQFSHEQYKTDNRNAYEGRVLAIIRPTKPGIIKVTAFSESLGPGNRIITVW